MHTIIIGSVDFNITQRQPNVSDVVVYSDHCQLVSLEIETENITEYGLTIQVVLDPLDPSKQCTRVLSNSFFLDHLGLPTEVGLCGRVGGHFSDRPGSDSHRRVFLYVCYDGLLGDFSANLLFYNSSRTVVEKMEIYRFKLVADDATVKPNISPGAINSATGTFPTITTFVAIIMALYS